MELDGVIDQVTDLVGEALQKAGDQIGIFVQDRAKENAPYRTGRLRDSITYESVPEAEDVLVKVGTNTEYAMYVEFGTGAKGDPSVSHTSKPFWRYKNEEGQWVTSHGQAPHPYLRPAVFRNEKAIRMLLKGEMEKVFQ